MCTDVKQKRWFEEEKHRSGSGNEEIETNNNRQKKRLRTRGKLAVKPRNKSICIPSPSLLFPDPLKFPFCRPVPFLYQST